MAKSNSIGCGCLTVIAIAVVGGLLSLGISSGDRPTPGATAPAPRPSGPAPTPPSHPPITEAPQISTNETGNAIPGLMPVDVYGNFDGKRGFVLADRRSMPDGSMYWQCKENGGGSYERDVEVYSTPGGATTVQSVRGTSLAYTVDPNETAREFLGFVATIPYQGSRPDEARRWVEDNVGRVASTSIGGVHFELSAGGRARMLRMTVDQHMNENAPQKSD